MAAEPTLTYDVAVVDGGARRPSLEDVGGARCEDDTEHAPSYEGDMPYAAMLNQMQMQIAAFGRMLPAARITIDFSSGAPFVSKLQTLSATLLAADFTLTDNGTGDTTISWTAGKLPARECDPMYSLDAGALTGVLIANVTRPTATSVRFKTFDDGVAANIRFTIDLN